MKAPRSVTEVMAEWDAHCAKAAESGATPQHLYLFARNAKVTLNEVLGAELAKREPVAITEPAPSRERGDIEVESEVEIEE